VATAAFSAWALVLSRTRGAWLGALAGLAVVAVLRAPRTLWLLGAAVLGLLLLRPAPLVDRLTVTDASSWDRYYMWQAGIDMILEKPIFGQGPGRIQDVYPGFRWPQAPNPEAPHLHDNAMQIAAERGLPCLIFWIWMMAAAMADALSLARRGPERDSGGAAFAVLTAVMLAGAFEYNFGDSEVLMFVLIVAALPYAVLRGRAALA
jgi:O-antigen ligase